MGRMTSIKKTTPTDNSKNIIYQPGDNGSSIEISRADSDLPKLLSRDVSKKFNSIEADIIKFYNEKLQEYQDLLVQAENSEYVTDIENKIKEMKETLAKLQSKLGRNIDAAGGVNEAGLK